MAATRWRKRGRRKKKEKRHSIEPSIDLLLFNLPQPLSQPQQKKNRVTQTRAFDTEAASSSYATGFVVDAARGIVLTNRHVTTPGPVTSEAIFLNREEVPVRPLYYDPIHDFGFLGFDPSKLQFMKLGQVREKREREGERERSEREGGGLLSLALDKKRSQNRRRRKPKTHTTSSSSSNSQLTQRSPSPPTEPPSALTSASSATTAARRSRFWREPSPAWTATPRSTAAEATTTSTPSTCRPPRAPKEGHRARPWSTRKGGLWR